VPFTHKAGLTIVCNFVNFSKSSEELFRHSLVDFNFLILTFDYTCEEILESDIVQECVITQLNVNIDGIVSVCVGLNENTSITAIAISKCLIKFDIASYCELLRFDSPMQNSTPIHHTNVSVWNENSPNSCHVWSIVLRSLLPILFASFYSIGVKPLKMFLLHIWSQNHYKQFHAELFEQWERYRPTITVDCCNLWQICCDSWTVMHSCMSEYSITLSQRQKCNSFNCWNIRPSQLIVFGWNPVLLMTRAVCHLGKRYIQLQDRLFESEIVMMNRMRINQNRIMGNRNVISGKCLFTIIISKWEFDMNQKALFHSASNWLARLDIRERLPKNLTATKIQLFEFASDFLFRHSI
jgi:hypothetical protein